MSATLEPAARLHRLDVLRSIGPIDCDLHPAPPAMAQLLPYLAEHWRESIISRGIDGLDLAAYPPRAPISARPDWRVPGGAAAADAATLGRQALDPYGTRIGILSCLHGAIAMYSEDMGAALATAVNDWLTAEWLDRDTRLRASVTVCMRDPSLAAAESGDPRVRVAIAESFVYGYRVVVWISVGLALASAISAYALLSSGRRSSRRSSS